MEDFNEETQRAKVVAGLKSPGHYFQNPTPVPPLRFEDGLLPEVKAKLGMGPIPAIPVEDTWVNRKGSSK